MKFAVCSVTHGTPCLVSELGWRNLAKREVNGIRCVRHGALLDYELDATNRKDARAKLIEQDARCAIRWS
jgi:hypothetical protein